MGGGISLTVLGFKSDWKSDFSFEFRVGFVWDLDLLREGTDFCRNVEFQLGFSLRLPMWPDSYKVSTFTG